MSSLLAGVAIDIGISWVKAGSAGEWYPEVGTLVNNSAVGGILENLEKETGGTYPHLEALRQEVVDRWRDYQSAMPWSKTGALEAYQAAVNAFAVAVESEEKATFDFLSGGLAGVVDTIKKPYILIGIVVVAVLVVVLLLIKR